MKRKLRVVSFSDITPERRAKAGQSIHDSWSFNRRPAAARVLTMRDWPLERLADQHRITPSQYLAGEKFRIHWTRCNASGSLASLDHTRVFSSDPTTRYGGFLPGHDRNSLIRAEQELRPVLYGLVVEIVCNHRKVSEMTGVIGRPANGHGVEKVEHLLSQALSILAKSWGV